MSQKTFVGGREGEGGPRKLVHHRQVTKTSQPRNRKKTGRLQPFSENVCVSNRDGRRGFSDWSTPAAAATDLPAIGFAVRSTRDEDRGGSTRDWQFAKNLPPRFGNRQRGLHGGSRQRNPALVPFRSSPMNCAQSAGRNARNLFDRSGLIKNSR